MKKIFLCFVFILFAGLSFAQESGTVHGAGVAPFGKTLFNIYGGIGAVDSRTRAEVVEANIQALAGDVLFDPQDLKITQQDDVETIIYRGKVIAGITDYQGQIEGLHKADLARKYRDVILSAVREEQAALQSTHRVRKYVMGGVVFVLMLLAIWGICKGASRLKDYIIAKQSAQNALLNNIIDSRSSRTFFIYMLTALKYVLIITVFYAGALIVLELLPQTRHFAAACIEYLLIPVKKGALAFYHYIPDLLDIIFIVVAFALLLKLLRNLAKKTAEGKIKLMGFHPDWALPTYHIARIIMAVFVFILIFPHLPGSGSDAFKGVSVFLGVLLSLGSTSLISNIMSGLVITYMSPFKEGDYIKMGDVTGEVVEKNTLVTRIRTYKNEVVTIPNSKVMTSDTINYSNSAKTGGLILHVDVTIGYDVDWRLVQKLLLEAAAKSEGAAQTPPPFVLQTELENFAVRYELNIYTEEPSRIPKTYSALYSNIQDVFNRENIEILTPQVNVLRGINGGQK
ncbi:small-conductance mechanosensitive channel [Elusimicrobium simillimum]|uniref:mechanosensitive ion channel family protein n=1 Tax=Elusimicrobium simillimum TaxID=3143438 RepID=UPI003C6F9509